MIKAQDILDKIGSLRIEFETAPTASVHSELDGLEIMFKDFCLEIAGELNEMKKTLEGNNG